MNDLPLAGRTAFVTGAARGFGLATAQALSERGAAVALVDVIPAPAAGDNQLALTVDVACADEVRAAIAATVARFGSLDIVVNNAGICPMTRFDEISEDEWDRVLAVNLKGVFLVSQAAMPHVRAAGVRGRIINVASSGGQMGGVLIGAHYSASKAGVIGLTKTLARLLAPDRATANCISPGTSATDLTAGWTDEQKARIRGQVPVGRFGEAHEIAAGICFLASDEAAFITGATLDMNGGLYMR
jgi:3-oxoacyl-[acyl-carrier protein] reductase